MSLPSWIRPAPGEGAVLSLKVTPRSSRSEIIGSLGAELRIKIAAPPVDGAANAALIALFSDLLDHSKSRIRMARGSSSRHKQLTVEGLAAEEIVKRLGVPPG